MRACLLITCAALAGVGCSAETSPSQRPLPSTQTCVAGATQGCTCTGDASGTQSCSPASTWNACQCAPAQPDSGNVDNPTDRPPVVDAGGLDPLPPARDCSPDLVISENGGTLFGLAGTFGFETTLQGALDCTTGEFRATGLGGRWGNAISSDPNDPDALWTVEEPFVRHLRRRAQRHARRRERRDHRR